jgi:hypothetical protein
MARKQRPRARLPASRKRAHRRPLLVPASPSEAARAVSPKVVPFTPRGRPAAQTAAAPPQVRIHDYSYVVRELRRIAIIGGGALLLVVILSFVLR